MDVAQGAVSTNNEDVICERPLRRCMFRRILSYLERPEYPVGLPQGTDTRCVLFLKIQNIVNADLRDKFRHVGDQDHCAFIL